MKKIITLLALIFVFGQMGYAQNQSTSAQAKKDILSKTESIEKQMKNYGITTGLKNTTLVFDNGPKTKYSYNSTSNYYSYFTKPDMVYYTFKLKTPTYENGDKFTFRVVISYDSYKYETTGYRTPYNKYVIHAVNISVDSYEGKELTDASLLNVLNNLSVEDAKVFKADKYKFVKIDSVNFTNLGQSLNKGVSSYDYYVDIYGVGADYMSAGVGEVEYEVESTANIHAVYKTNVYLNKGQWKISNYAFQYLHGKSKYTDIKKDKTTPAYKTINQSDLKTVMAGFTVENDIPKTSYRAYNDLKRMLLVNFERETKETFIQGDEITHLFSTEHGKAVVDMFFGIKKTIKDYHLEKISITCSNYASRIKNEGDSDEIRISYRVKRELTNDELKLAKKDPNTSKEAKKILKFKATGYFKLRFEVTLIDGKYIITNHKEVRNDLKYRDGGQDTKHPLYKEP